MSDLTSNATINLSVNGQAVEEKLKKYQKQLVELREKAKRAAEIGDKGTLQKTQKEIRKVENEMRKVRTATANVEDTIRNLDKATPKNLKKDLQTLKAQLNGLERGSEAWNAHVKKIKLLDSELKKINAEMKMAESRWTRFNRVLNDCQTSLMGFIAATTGLIMAGRKSVTMYAEMEEELANTRKYTGLTTEKVVELNEAFKQMDTRTSREQLNELAQEAGRLGKNTIEDVKGYVEAADIINVALVDLGEGATQTIAKISNIFGVEQMLGTKQAMLSIGSAVNVLSQNCTASKPYLVDFAQRMAGIGAQAGLTVPEILAFGAVLDANGQKVEMSATAIQKVIMNLANKNGEFAKSLGMDAELLNKTLKKNATEGLLMFLEKIREIGKEKGFENATMSLAPAFKEMGLDAARVATVLSTLAGHIDEVKSQIEVSNKAFKEAKSATNEYNIFNNTVQAGIDKAKKKIHEIGVQLGEELLPVMKHVMTSTSLTMRLMLIAVRYIKEYATEIAMITAAIVAYKIAVNASNIAFKIHYGYLVVSKAATTAYNAVTKGLTAAKLVLNIALAKINGNYARQIHLLGELKKANIAAKGLYGLLAAAVSAFIVKLYAEYEAKKKIREKRNEEMKQERERMKAYSDEYARINALNRILHDNKKSYEDRKAALDKLKEVVPEYHAELKREGELINDNTEALDTYLEKFKQTIRAKANQEKYEALIKEESELQGQREEANKKYWDIRTQNTIQGYDRNSFVGRVTNAIGKITGDTDTEAGAKKALDDLDSRIGEVQQKIKELDYVVAPSLIKEDEETKTGGETGGNGNEEKKKGDKFAKEKAWKDKELALNRIAYATGKKDYEQYQNAILEIEEQYQTKILARKDLTEQESLEAQASFHEAEMKLRQKAISQNKDDADAMYADLKAIEDQRYADGLISAEQYEKAIRMLELKHLRELVNIYDEGSKERLEAEKRYEAAILEDKKRNRKKIEDAEREHQKKLDDIRNGVFSDTPSKQKDMFDTDLAALTTVYEQEKIAAAGNKEDLLRIEENFQKAKMALAYKYDQITAENGFNSMQIANEKLLKWMESDQGQAVLQTYDMVMEGMTNIFSACSDIIQAELEIETAAIEKRYEKEISAAEGNKYKVKQLEEKKQKEEAAAKNKANKKMYAMQVMQAIASTAMGALNAYASAAQVPLIGYILAPIAAATAIATGMLQVANIKKQQQASEAQGYAEGGYTGSGGKYEPRGIVHAGEWVASQKLLANPQTAAIIQALDYAQKTNTIGSISPSMVSNDTTAAATIARLSSSSSSSSDNGLADSISRLNKRLNEPFVTVNTMTGDHGIKQAQDEYDIYIRNKTPKSRR